MTSRTPYYLAAAQRSLVNLLMRRSRMHCWENHIELQNTFVNVTVFILILVIFVNFVLCQINAVFCKQRWVAALTFCCRCSALLLPLPLRLPSHCTLDRSE